MTDPPPVHYARVGESYVAYQTLGTGPPDILFIRNAFNHLEMQWEDPKLAAFLEGLASFGRLIVFDARGGGLSDPFRGAGVPAIEDWADDALSVLTQVGANRVSIVGSGVACSRAAVLAAGHPDRVASLVAIRGRARVALHHDYPHAPQPLNNEELERAALSWGEDAPPPLFGLPDDDDALSRWTKRYLRASVSPGTLKDLLRWGTGVDVRAALDIISCPTLVLDADGCPEWEHHAAIDFAERIEGAEYQRLPQTMSMQWRFSDPAAAVAVIQGFLTGTTPAPATDRVLATVMYTDIVDSTPRAAELGDDRWKVVLDDLDALVTRQLEEGGGRLIKNTGDGHLATFDAPGRAIRTASAIRDRAKTLDLDLRIGLHTGEIERRGEDITGLGVVIAQRVMDAADAGEILVSQSIPPLVAGTLIPFADRGTHELKGVPGEWTLFRVDEGVAG